MLTDKLRAGQVVVCGFLNQQPTQQQASAGINSLFVFFVTCVEVAEDVVLVLKKKY